MTNKRQQTRLKKEKMEDDGVIVFSCAMLTLACAVDMLSNEKAKKPRNRKIWMKDWLRERDKKGAYANILQELCSNDHKKFRKYLHMNTDIFQVALLTFVHLRYEHQTVKKNKKEEMLVLRVLQSTLPN